MHTHNANQMVTLMELISELLCRASAMVPFGHTLAFTRTTSQSAHTAAPLMPSAYDPAMLFESQQLVDSFMRNRLKQIKGDCLKTARFVSQEHVRCTVTEFMDLLDDVTKQRSDLFCRLMQIQHDMVCAVELVLNSVLMMQSRPESFLSYKAELLSQLNSQTFAKFFNQTLGFVDSHCHGSFCRLVDQVAALENGLLNEQQQDLARYILLCLSMTKNSLQPSKMGDFLGYHVTALADIKNDIQVKKLLNIKPSRFLFVERGYRVSILKTVFKRVADRANAIHGAQLACYKEMSRVLALMYQYLDQSIALLLKTGQESIEATPSKEQVLFTIQANDIVRLKSYLTDSLSANLDGLFNNFSSLDHPLKKFENIYRSNNKNSYLAH